MRLFIILGLLAASTYAAGEAGYVYKPNVVTSSRTLLSPVMAAFKSIVDTQEIAIVQRPAIAGSVMGMTQVTLPPVTGKVVNVAPKPKQVITKISSASIGVTEAAIRRSAPGGVVSAEKVGSRLSKSSEVVNKLVKTSEVVETKKTTSSVVKEPTSFAFRGGFNDKIAQTSEIFETQKTISSVIKRPKSINVVGGAKNTVAVTSAVAETQKTASSVVKEPKGFIFKGGFNYEVAQTSEVVETKKPVDNRDQQFDRSETVLSEVSTAKKVVKSKVPFGRPRLEASKQVEETAGSLPTLNSLNLEGSNNDLSATEKLIGGVFGAAGKVGGSKTVKSLVGLGTNGIAVNTEKIASATEVKKTSILADAAGAAQSDNKIVSSLGNVPTVLKGSFKSECVQVVKPSTYPTISPVNETALRPSTNFLGFSKVIVPDATVRSSAFDLDKIVSAANLGAIGGLSQTENSATGNINESLGHFYTQGPALIKSTVAVAPVNQLAAHSPVSLRSNTPTYSTVLPGIGKPISATTATGITRKTVPLSTIGSTKTADLFSGNKFGRTVAPSTINTGTQIIASNVQPHVGGFSRSGGKQQNAYEEATSNVIGTSINRLRTLPLAGTSPKINLVPSSHILYSSGIENGVEHGLSSIALKGVGILYNSAANQGLRSLPLLSTGKVTSSNVPIMNSGGVAYSSAARGGSNYAAGLTALDYIPATVQYNKQVFFFSTPEEVVNESEITYQIKNSLKKNIQVVLINAPDNVAETKSTLQLAKQAIEQKTSIYVLSEEQNTAQMIRQIQEFQKDISPAPEVNIIKYQTPQELAHAREEILSKYNNFGAISSLIDAGVTPVLNYASANVKSAVVPPVNKVLTDAVPIQESVLVLKGSRGSYFPPSHL